MKTYKLISFSLMIAFIAVGMVFLFIPAQVLVFFNNLSDLFGLPLIPVHEAGFYNILAVGYMYLVALFAFFMFRHPENPHFPHLLAHGKFASSFLSLGFAVIVGPYLIILVNCVTDGLIGLIALYFYLKLKRKNP